MKDPATGRPRVRMVDIDSDRYRIARSFMLRLRREDFENPETMAQFCAVAHLTPERFREEFYHLVKDDPTRALNFRPGVAANPVGPTK